MVFVSFDLGFCSVLPRVSTGNTLARIIFSFAYCFYFTVCSGFQATVTSQATFIFCLAQTSTYTNRDDISRPATPFSEAKCPCFHLSEVHERHAPSLRYSRCHQKNPENGILSGLLNDAEISTQYATSDWSWRPPPDSLTSMVFLLQDLLIACESGKAGIGLPRVANGFWAALCRPVLLSISD